MVNGPEQWQRHQEAGPVWTLGPEILCAHTTDSPKLMKHSQGCKFGVTSKATEYPSRSYYLPNYSHFPLQFLLLECVFEDWWRQNDEVAFPTQRAGLRPWQSRVFLTPHCAPHYPVGIIVLDCFVSSLLFNAFDVNFSSSHRATAKGDRDTRRNCFKAVRSERMSAGFETKPLEREHLKTQPSPSRPSKAISYCPHYHIPHILCNILQLSFPSLVKTFNIPLLRFVFFNGRDILSFQRDFVLLL